MATSSLDEIPQALQERLAFIEFRLLFLGFANRSDLAQRFGVSESAASRDFALYRQLAPDNLYYDRSTAVYQACSPFMPVFHFAPAQVLTALVEGFGDDFVTGSSSWLPAELPSRPTAPSLELLIPLSRALYRGRTLQISYRSLSSGLGQKRIIPLVLVDSGQRWHVRAYDLGQQRYADFVLNRIEHAELAGEAPDQERLRQEDIAWQHHIELELTPHPQLKHPETVAFEYGMQDQCLQLSVRAALAGYLLRQWNVDCTPSHSLSGPEYLLWLRNAEQLQQHQLTIAPGFMDAGQHRHTEAMDAEA